MVVVVEVDGVVVVELVVDVVVVVEVVDVVLELVVDDGGSVVVLVVEEGVSASAGSARSTDEVPHAARTTDAARTAA